MRSKTLSKFKSAINQHLILKEPEGRRVKLKKEASTIYSAQKSDATFRSGARKHDLKFTFDFRTELHYRKSTTMSQTYTFSIIFTGYNIENRKFIQTKIINYSRLSV